MKHFRMLLSAIATTFGLLAIAAPALAAPPANPSLMISRMERDVGGALAHLAVLREEMQKPGEASAVADAAGISDGGRAVTLRTLRHTVDAIDRRLTALRSGIRHQSDPRKAEVLLIMRVELNGLIWALEELAEDDRADEAEMLDSIQLSLEELDGATAAMATFDWTS